MWETLIVILTVLAAATGVGYGLYRSASGKAGCAGCRGCDQISCREPVDLADGAYDMERK